MDSGNSVGIAAFVLIPLSAFLAGIVAGAGWERQRSGTRAGGIAGIGLVAGLVFAFSVLQALFRDEPGPSAIASLASAAFNAWIVLVIGATGAAAGLGLSRLQRTREMSLVRLVLLSLGIVLGLLAISGACVGIVYLFSDVGLELPATATSEP